MILFLSFGSCKDVAIDKTKQVQIKADSTELEIEPPQQEAENLKLTSFLENPIDLQEFKKRKGRDEKSYVTTGVDRGTDYYFNPKFSDSVFYGYHFITEDVGQDRFTEIIVFKYGEGKHSYEDGAEILIELRVFSEDEDLGRANLVGLTKNELELAFGTDYMTFDDKIVYSGENKILIVVLGDSKVKSFRYVKLNTENVDRDFIRRMLK